MKKYGLKKFFLQIFSSTLKKNIVLDQICKKIIQAVLDLETKNFNAIV